MFVYPQISKKIIFTYTNSSHIKDPIEEDDLFQFISNENKNGPGNIAQWQNTQNLKDPGTQPQKPLAQAYQEICKDYAKIIQQNLKTLLKFIELNRAQTTVSDTQGNTTEVSSWF